MRIIPAIDIIEGKCVRLTKGDYATKKVYNVDPLEVAKKFESHGINHLHLVDLDGAKSKHIVNYKVLDRICSRTSLHVDFGGGLKSNDDLRIAFECGANQITAGSIAVQSPSAVKDWLKLYGAQRIILGADCIDRKIATNGWLEQSDLDVIEFVLNYENEGIQYTICTDVSKDGMLQGPSIQLYQEIMDQSKVSLIASGGIATLDDLYQLHQIGCEGAIIGKAIYERSISLTDLEKTILELQ